MKRIIVSSLVTLLIAMSGYAQDQQEVYKFESSIPLSGSGKAGYMKMDGDRNWIYITHQDRVHLIDLKNDSVLVTWTGFKNAQGLWPGKKLDKMYINDAGKNTVEVYNTLNFKKLRSIPVPCKQLGWLLYDRHSQQAFVFGKESHNVVVIDGATDSIMSDTPLNGASEFACTDDTTYIYATIRDKNEIALIDVVSHKVAKTFKLTEDKGPTGITIDVINNRLMVACTQSNTMVVLDQTTGEKIGSYPIGKGCEGLIYEKDLRLVITSNGDGTLSIFRQVTPDKYEWAQTIHTAQSYKYMCHRGTTHKFYLSGSPKKADGTKKGFALQVYAPVIH